MIIVQADGFSGADLAALLREAGLDVLRQLKTRELIVGKGAYTEEGESSGEPAPCVEPFRNPLRNADRA